METEATSPRDRDKVESGATISDDGTISAGPTPGTTAAVTASNMASGGEQG